MGTKKMASSQAMPAVGRRLRGTMMTAMTRMTMSMTMIAAATIAVTCVVVMSIVIRRGVRARAWLALQPRCGRTLCAHRGRRG